MRVVATAGHVDHGKSTLLRALTGMEPDRYEEERRRGLTIDLGFVWTTLPSGRGVAFVDVPGHARLVRTMLAGVGAVDLCVFVVAADEGWMPQSEEHLRILELVGATDGVVVVTKIDTVDDRERATVRGEIAERLAGTFLDGRPVVEVDARRGTGLDRLAAALDDLLDRAAPPPMQDRPRLWVDRCFAIKGAGTVVTGTLAGGMIAVGDGLVAHDPKGRPLPTRIRGLQSQERPRDVVGPGQRVAVNLSGVHHAALGRGAVLVRGGQWRPTARLDVAVRVLDDAELGNRRALLAYLGTTEQPVRVRLLEGRDRSWVDADELQAISGERRVPTAGRWVVAPAALAEARRRIHALVAAGGRDGADLAGFDERLRALLPSTEGIVVDHGRVRSAGVADTDATDHPWLRALEASPFTPPL